MREKARILSASVSSPTEFWNEFLTLFAGQLNAERAVFLIEGKEGEPAWKTVARYSRSNKESEATLLFRDHLEKLVQRGAAERESFIALSAIGEGAPNDCWVLIEPIEIFGSQIRCVVTALFSGCGEEEMRRKALLAPVLASVPKSSQLELALRKAENDVAKFAGALDITLEANSEKRFVATGLALCNSLATHFSCERVAIGWLVRGFAQLKAVSRTEKFDRKMELAQDLERVMDECLEQDEEIIWPKPEDKSFVARDHESFAAKHGSENLCTLPLRLHGETCAAVCCERTGTPFSSEEIDRLRLACDLVAARLGELHRQDRWFGARWLSSIEDGLKALVGPKHTVAKASAIAGAIALAVLAFVKVDHRIEARFLVKSNEVRYITAPFDGYIESAFFESGDGVKEGEVLFEMDTEPLDQEQLAAVAEVNRYAREAQRARASDAAAEMEIASALAAQSQARLSVARYRLGQAVVKTPFNGIIIEGDLKESLNAPVSQGDTLMQIAQVDDLYIEADIDERDIHLVKAGDAAEVSFVSRPKLKFPVIIEKIEAAAAPKEGINVFAARGEFAGDLEPWWRPGMSGICKIEVGRKSLLAIWTRRTVDFLRMKLWW